MASSFDVSSLWLSPLMKEASNHRLIHRVNYVKEDNLIIETPLLCVNDLQLVLENGGSTHKILLRTKLVTENIQFKKVMRDIDQKLQAEANFGGLRTEKCKFLPSLDYNSLFSFFIPVHNSEVSVLVVDTAGNNSFLSLKSLKRSSLCRLVLLLSHVEAVGNLFFPIWNVIQIRLAS